ncbi:AraC family transcriptional regulator [Cohnella sp. REN36]|uniref:AraC family transcriptional regulator n=1 Tax=Cohnella sp. REN36 TaxID=2887347 RepID=UPI001D13BE02|nr:AraC family transcriptional regulator [Cohnella sp. REN36]MCC3371524.1 AraC family transcriptional regulator [Cohnella sp. REN36]
MLVLEMQVPPMPLLAAIGHVLWQPGVVHAERRFDVYDLIVVAKGALYMEEDGIRYDISAGRVLVLEPGRLHRGYRPTDAETEVYWIHFRHPHAAETMPIAKTGRPQSIMQSTDQATEPLPAVISIPKFGSVDLRTLVPLLQEMLALHVAVTPARSYALHLLFGQALLQLQNGLRENGPEARAYEIGERAAAYLAGRLELPFDSGRMECDLNYHFDYLSRCLKLTTGMSPLQYRHRLQMERAKRLLAHSDDPLVQVGEQCGFHDYTYFTRLFKRHTALTPGAYRKRHQLFRLD